MNEIKLQVGVKVILRNKEGKYLILKRNTEKYKNVRGEWDIPGGRINPGTLLIDNLRREVFEETKLEIQSDPKLLYAQDIIPNAEKHVVRLTYTATADGDPKLDLTENTEYKWLTADELKILEGLDIYVKEILNKGIFE